ncbi:flagellar biosynthesis protein FliZ [Borrelia coriaceae]|uniref:Flagellar biosynthetic protein fliZ n=1 Tax=Borrelia coriaceae ATCC 43381 TaxID=1408429 RepID=W5SUV4_9SPIR|nr:flagellar biosynthesis protein FliZ [Borrelia coriaceae]AHH10443.1 Flagellar biosynthetic protein fliZ [Borrelia coriaceae ATCC 43381]UPA16147.1 flagellar biosynthesis protein FliZ [Borrelia coriaceae]
MSNLALLKFLFLIVFIFFFKNLFAQEKEINLDITPSSLESEVNLPIFEDDKSSFNNKDIQNVSIVNLSDLVTIFLFLLFFLICIFLFKKMIFNHSKISNEDKSAIIRELAFYEIDNKNSLRIINILGDVYVFLISSNSSILLREIKRGEELDSLKFELDKAKNRSNLSSFKSIFNKVLYKNKKYDSLLDETEREELEHDIETSLKNKQDRLKKF